MNYIENIYICIALPLLIAIFCAETGKRASLLFMLIGATMCLCSAYISTFLMSVWETDAISASINITPMVEEIMKLLPVLFYLLVFQPHREAGNGILMIAVGFATFENICYLTTNGASNFSYLLIRGAGTGSMHVVCGLLLGLGLRMLWDVRWLKAVGTLSVLSLAVTYHAIYNLLVSQTGAVAVVGFLLPLLTVAAVLIFGRKLLREASTRE